MKRLTIKLWSMLSDETGANILEYSLLVTFIMAVTVVAVALVGQHTAANVGAVAPGL